jgi:hypothetical protein
VLSALITFRRFLFIASREQIEAERAAKKAANSGNG